VPDSEHRESVGRVVVHGEEEVDGHQLLRRDELKLRFAQFPVRLIVGNLAVQKLCRMRLCSIALIGVDS
jgi:hypothetical protein